MSDDIAMDELLHRKAVERAQLAADTGSILPVGRYSFGTESTGGDYGQTTASHAVVMCDVCGVEIGPNVGSEFVAVLAAVIVHDQRWHGTAG